MLLPTLPLLVFACSESSTNPPVYKDPITITAPDNNASVSGVVIVRTAVGEDYYFLRVDFYVDGDSVHTDSSWPFTYPWDTGIYPSSSQHQLQAVAFDSTTSYESDIVNVTVLIPSTDEFVFASTYPTAAPAERVASEGGHLYIAAGTQGLYVVDVADAHSPQLLYRFTAIDVARGLGSDSPYLVTAGGDEGIRLFGTADPDTISILTFYNTAGYSWNVKVLGSRIYIADNDALQIVTISGNNLLPNARFPINDGQVKDVDAVGSVAFVLDVNGLTVVDVTQAGSPDTLDRYSSFSGQCRSVTAGQGLVFVGTSEELVMLSAANPANITFITRYIDQAGITGVFLDGSLLFASRGGSSGGALAFDISTGLALNLLDSHINNDNNLDIAAENGFVYLGRQSGVDILQFDYSGR